jgi:hypothetical protein
MVMSNEEKVFWKKRNMSPDYMISDRFEDDDIVEEIEYF